MEALFRRLNGQMLRRDDEDVMNWWISKKGLFTVKSFYSSLAPCNAREFLQALFGILRYWRRLAFFLGKLFGGEL